MTTVTIKSMSLKNFKGFSKLDRVFDSKRENICAKNGSGKTTLMYAWWWALGFDVPDVIPTLDNQEIHNLETQVTVVLDVDGYEYRLCRTQTEEWKTNRATGIEEKHTNKSAYAIDNVEFTLKNYKEKLEGIFGVSNDKLEMLTNKDYFNSEKAPKWTWTARRKELFELTGAADLLKGLADKSDYALIADDLKKGFSSTEIRKAKMKALRETTNNKERNATIIAERQNDLAKYGAMDFAALEAQKVGYEAQITELNLAILKEQESGDTAQIKAQIDALVAERTSLQLADRSERTRLENEVKSCAAQKQSMERYGAQLKSQRVDVDELHKKLVEKKASKWQGDTVCPTCGQALPTERIEEAKRKFASAVAQDADILEEKLAKAITANAALDAELQELREGYANMKSAECLAVAELDNFEPNPRIAALDGEIAALKAKADGVRTETVDAKQEAITEAKAALEQVQAKLAYKRVVNDIKTRIEELKILNRGLTDNEMVLKGAIEQLDAYVAEQVGLVTETINRLFGNGVSYALFTENYAGAESELKETCTCMWNGKVYTSMSTGEKFFANVEVIKALQKAYDVNLPIFCENAECFTEEVDAEQQMIMLCATPDATIENCIRVQNENYNTEV